LTSSVPVPLQRVLAAAALIVLSPLIAVLVVSIALALGRSVLFRQERIGLGGRHFTLHKFRTMTHAVDPETGELLPDAERTTRFGMWLRSTSLDELPELWDVVRGEMALVGPRPLPVRYAARFTPYEWRRHEVRPGLTGWAQVHGRNAVGWDERLALDVWYVEHRSLRLDLRILLLTVGLVLGRRGIGPEEAVTMPELRPPAT
jgi:sugar transferase EpsL